MATSPRRDIQVPSYPPSADETVRLLLRLQKAAQKINSILDLDDLLEAVVDQVCEVFGCLETAILLKEDYSDDLVIRATRGCSVHLKGERFSRGRGLVSHAAQLGQTLYTPDVAVDPRYVKCEATTRSEIDIPLKVCDSVIGVFTVAHPELDGFSRPERQVLEAMAATVSIAIDNATRFQRERLERERMRIEQEEARKIQESMLPKRSPEIEGFRLHGRSVPAGIVGGDFFDYVRMRDGRIGIVLADVSGKGLPAALLMATTRGVLCSLARQHASAVEVIQQLNTILVEDFPAEKFVTMVFAVLDPARGTLQFVNAGHPAPVLVHDGHATLLGAGCGLPLGIMECAYCECEVQLQPGTSLVLFSDGISERANSDADEYGMDRLLSFVSRNEVSADAILRDVDAFAPGTPQHDDSTVIVLQRI